MLKINRTKFDNISNKDIKIGIFLQIAVLPIVWFLNHVFKFLSTDCRDWISIFLFGFTIFVLIKNFKKYYWRSCIIDKNGVISDKVYITFYSWCISKLFHMFSIYIDIVFVLRFLGRVFSFTDKIDYIIITLMLFHLMVEVFKFAIAEQYKIYVHILTPLIFIGILSAISVEKLLTLFVSVLFIGIINWLVSEDAFRYLQIVNNFPSKNNVVFNQDLKRELSAIRAKMLFFSISFNIAVYLSELLIESTKIIPTLSTFFVQIHLVDKTATFGQEFFSESVLKLFFFFLFYFFIKRCVVNLLTKSRSFGIPIISKIVQEYNDLLTQEYRTFLNEESEMDIYIKKYYIKKFDVIASRSNMGKLLQAINVVYIQYDKDGLFNACIYKKTFKKMPTDRKRLWIRIRKSKLENDLTNLKEALK